MKNTNITPVKSMGMAITFQSSNKNAYPIIYSDDEWAIAKDGTKLKEILGHAGTYTQEEINEKFSEKASSAATSLSGITNNVGQLRNDLNILSGDTKALSGATVSIGKGLSTLSGDTKSLSGATTSIENNLSTLSGDTKTLSGATTSIGSNLSDLSGATEIIDSWMKNDTIGNDEIDALFDTNA
jgi:hypothetical protein